MEFFMIVFKILEILLLAYLGGSSLYILLFALAGLFKGRDPIHPHTRTRFITIIIPAYGEDSVIVETISNSLIQNYPETSFHVILVADSFKSETVEILKKFPITLVEISLNISTKVKSLQKALELLPHETEVVLILDADNLMGPDMLQKLNNVFETGIEVVQCHRLAKNTNTSYALLDAISEEINNHIFRKGHAALGLSPALIGSAMAFSTSIFRSYIPRLEAIGGFDKELELLLQKDEVPIWYLDDALVLDEKIQNAKVFYKQRKRWIYSQFFYFGTDFLKSIWLLPSKGNIQYFNKALQFSLPPRIVTLGLLFTINVIYLFFPISTLQVLWMIALVACITAIFTSIPFRFYSLKSLKALISLPKIFFIMIFILLRLRGANKQFIHTEHEFINNPDQPLKNNKYENRD